MVLNVHSNYKANKNQQGSQDYIDYIDTEWTQSFEQNWWHRDQRGRHTDDILSRMPQQLQ